VLIEELLAATDAGHWASLAQTLLGDASAPMRIEGAFSTYWIEGGHRIREQVADDCLLVCLLRHLLPPYRGEATTLFRGENIERFEAGRVGFAWSSHIEVARMFGRGLNSVPGGGVLLRARFEPTAIICGSLAHSQYLGEDQCTIDPFAGTVITAAERFPAASP
jgi:hypothetical protein